MSTTVSNSRIQSILKLVGIILSNEQTEKKLKGESFNIFSILNVERRENGTHAAFLGELLNPAGSHLMGNRFLSLFLILLKEDKRIDINSARVILERSIGPKVINKNNPLESTGGRIDIYIEDDFGNTISIENKIDDMTEQEMQVVRYWNHRKEKNQVYYLTLNGKTPSEHSTSTLKADEDYREIKYDYHILKWLSQCQKEACESPILRESIKQYSHLIKKITGKMEDRHQAQLYNIILSDFEAVDSIVKNSNAARERLCGEIRDLVLTGLVENFSDMPEIEFELGSDITQKHSQIWFSRNDQNKENRLLHFVLESFNGKGNNGGEISIGIVNPPPHDSEFGTIHDNILGTGNWIINGKILTSYQGHSLNLGNSATIQKLHTDEPFKSEYINHIVKETREYFDEQYPNLKAFLNKELLKKIAKK